jgi:hypothetical protein
MRGFASELPSIKACLVAKSEAPAAECHLDDLGASPVTLPSQRRRRTDALPCLVGPCLNGSQRRKPKELKLN